MDYLSACLKKSLDFDTKKFVLLKLSEIYESHKMYLEAGKLLRVAAEINTTFEGKMQDFMKSSDLYIKGGNFDEAEISYTKALACSSGAQKERLRVRRKEAYKLYAQECVSKDKRKHAMGAYQRYLSIHELTQQERREVQILLLTLYEKLGKIVEYNGLKRIMLQPAQSPQPLTEKKSSFSYNVRSSICTSLRSC